MENSEENPKKLTMKIFINTYVRDNASHPVPVNDCNMVKDKNNRDFKYEFLNI